MCVCVHTWMISSSSLHTLSYISIPTTPIPERDTRPSEISQRCESTRFDSLDFDSLESLEAPTGLDSNGSGKGNIN